MKLAIAVLGFLVTLSAASSDAQILTRGELHPARISKARERLNIVPPPPLDAQDFDVQVSPRQRIMRQGDTISIDLTITGGSTFAGPVKLKVRNWPNGIVLPDSSIAPDMVTLSPGQTGLSSLTLVTSSSTDTGSFEVFIDATSGSTTHSAKLELAINRPNTDLFSQGTVAFNTDDPSKPAVAVQVIDQAFGPILARFRSTLPIASTTPKQGESIYAQPNSNLREQLLDLYGGIINFALGAEWVGVGPRGNVSFDIRGAVKMVEVPRAKDDSSSDAYANSVVGSGGAKLSVVLYDKPTGNPATLYLTAAYFCNVVPTTWVASKFSTPLQQFASNLNTGLVVNVPRKHFYATLLYRWSDDKQVGDQIVLSVSPAK